MFGSSFAAATTARIHAIAMAGDSDGSQLLVLLFDSGATSLVRTIPLQPRSQYVGFVDEILNVPAAGLAHDAAFRSGRLHKHGTDSNPLRARQPQLSRRPHQRSLGNPMVLAGTFWRAKAERSAEPARTG